MNNTLDNNEFFNLIASDYDEMVSFAQSVEKKKEAFKGIIKPWMQTAADLGCGTGADSVALASLDLEVTGFDPSPEMIRVANENAKKEKLDIAFQISSIHSIPESLTNKFDMVVSLGNTFANVDRKFFSSSVKKCSELLKPSGVLVIQVLNYEKILSEEKRIVNIREGKESYFIRFYDFIDNEITFNILIFKKEKPSEHKLISTKLFPHTRDDFYNILKKMEFSKVEYFSEFELATFHKEQSKDLIIRAIKE
jgi:ubiquinone/menaquinone biosynthesis C-methylase UbiE